jgi:hypothetical protein
MIGVAIAILSAWVIEQAVRLARTNPDTAARSFWRYEIVLAVRGALQP